jgi:ATP-dependent DNA helicase RecG
MKTLSKIKNFSIENLKCLPNELLTPIQFVKGVGPSRVRSFNRLGIYNVYDLLHYFPKWHIHKSIISKMNLINDSKCFYLATIVGAEEKIKNNRHILKVLVQDDTDYSIWTWFNREYLKFEMKPGRFVLIHGRIEEYKWGKQIVCDSDEFVFLTEEEVKIINNGDVLPIYHTTKVLNSKLLREIFFHAVPKYSLLVPDFLPTKIRESNSLINISDAIRILHIPRNIDELEEARRRIVFDELFLLQIFLAKRKLAIEHKKKNRIYKINEDKIKSFQEKLPFNLTNAQKRCINEIISDLKKQKPMNRLLQGDVGSGKTIVAAHLLLIAVDNGYQAAVMAPTEILAEQHYMTLSQLLNGVARICLLTGGLKQKEKMETLSKIKNGEYDIVIGTHALLEKNVIFKNLAVIIIDERHKFGVSQRVALQNKSEDPDCLMMTATPFPRALILTLYGDTDLSIIDELPPGRLPVITKWVYENQKSEVYEFIRKKVRNGEQAYIVYPLVEESEKLDLKSATSMAEFLKKNVFYEFRIGLIHGRLNQEEKEKIMNEFRKRKIDILISTSVIESGIDISNVTVILIEHADRFGLAQLHQLRGRVGRGTKRAYCFLSCPWKISREAKERLKIFTSTTDGFKIAQKDLEIRGPGELLGVKQHGNVDFHLIDICKDIKILEDARKEAYELVENDPYLINEENRLLKWKFEQKFVEELELLRIS